MRVNWEFESELALKAVSQGAEITFERSENLEISQKESPRDIVTQIDKRIEAFISSILKDSPYPIIGEETFTSQSTLPPLDSTYWLIDPIDGTANFVSQVPFYGTSVGLWTKDNFAVGAISLPAQKEIFFTYGDQGAFLNGRTIHVQDVPLKSSLIAAGFSGVAEQTDFRKRQYEAFGSVNDKSRGCLRLGSAATNLCYVSVGRIQACYGIDNQIWDVAAGIAIARQAGAKVKLSRKPDSTRISYIVGSPSAVDELSELLERKQLFL